MGILEDVAKLKGVEKERGREARLERIIEELGNALKEISESAAVTTVRVQDATREIARLHEKLDAMPKEKYEPVAGDKVRWTDDRGVERTGVVTHSFAHNGPQHANWYEVKAEGIFFSVNTIATPLSLVGAPKSASAMLPCLGDVVEWRDDEGRCREDVVTAFTGGQSGTQYMQLSDENGVTVVTMRTDSSECSVVRKAGYYEEGDTVIFRGLRARVQKIGSNRDEMRVAYDDGSAFVLFKSREPMLRLAKRRP